MTKRGVIISTSVIVAILTVFTILFGVVFRVRNIEIVNDKDFHYTINVDEIVTASKLKKNSSIFDIDRNKIIHNLETEYPFARVGINLSGLTSVKITLSNRSPLYYFVENEICYILDEDCKVLEIITLKEYNDNNYDLIKLQNVISIAESVSAGQFLECKYSKVLNDLYNSLYSNAMIQIDNGLGEFESKYLEREDMCEIINDINFTQEYEMSGKVDKLIMTTSFGLKISIIEPQKNLDSKINRAFSVFRALQIREDGATLIQQGEININYAYDENNNVTLVCEYRA